LAADDTVDWLQQLHSASDETIGPNEEERKTGVTESKGCGQLSK